MGRGNASTCTAASTLQSQRPHIDHPRHEFITICVHFFALVCCIAELFRRKLAAKSAHMLVDITPPDFLPTEPAKSSLASCASFALAPPASPCLVVEVVLRNKNPPTPCLWQAPASTQKTKRKTRPAIRQSAQWRANAPPCLSLPFLEGGVAGTISGDSASDRCGV